MARLQGNIDALRNQLLHDLLAVNDVNLLKELAAMVRSSLKVATQKAQVVGYNPDGSAITRKEIDDDLKLAQKELLDGSTISEEEMELISESWL